METRDSKEIFYVLDSDSQQHVRPGMLCIPLHNAHDGLAYIEWSAMYVLNWVVCMHSSAHPWSSRPWHYAQYLCVLCVCTLRLYWVLNFTLELKCVYAHLFCSFVSLYAQCSVLYLACKQYLLLTLCLHTIFISSEFMYVSTFGLVVRRECAYT